MQLIKIIDQLEFTYPIKDAAKWDFVGWQVKSENKEINIDNILVTLDVTESVIDEAIKNNIKLIIAHHPFIFAKNISALMNDTWKKTLYQKLLDHEINVFVLHTNFDKNLIGMSFLIAKDLKLNKIKHFDPEKFSVVGEYDNLSLSKVIKNVKKYYDIDKVKVVTNDFESKINKVIIAAGAGGIIIEFLNKTIGSPKDISLVITGEMKWHQELEARDKNISVLILGHEMEEKFVNFIATFLEDKVFKKNPIKIQKYIAPKSELI